MLQYDQDGEGLPVILIHGFPLCRKMWKPQIDALVNRDYRVICPDLPGFGDSPALKDSVSMSRYADEVVGLMDRLGIDQAVIGGMSMGGYVLLNLLERYPKRLSAAMFLVTRAAADDAAGKQKRTALAAEVEAGNRMIVPDAFAGVLFAPQTPEEKPDLVAEVRDWMESTSPEGVIGGLLAMRDRPDSVAQLPGYSLPCLVVGAEQDVAVPLEHSRVLVEGLPNAELKIIAGAGHMANLEQPEWFNQALLGFLEEF
jgi:pimeloyl-ACP methyl ester carboxylesterase